VLNIIFVKIKKENGFTTIIILIFLKIFFSESRLIKNGLSLDIPVLKHYFNNIYLEAVFPKKLGKNYYH